MIDLAYIEFLKLGVKWAKGIPDHVWNTEEPPYSLDDAGGSVWLVVCTETDRMMSGNLYTFSRDKTLIEQDPDCGRIVKWVYFTPEEVLENEMKEGDFCDKNKD
jgi:hypothetical protein